MKNKELILSIIEELPLELKQKFYMLFPNMEKCTWKSVYAALGNNFLKAHPVSKQLISIMPKYIADNNVSQFNKDHKELKVKMHDTAKFFGITYKEYAEALGLDLKVRFSRKNKLNMTIAQQVDAHPNTPAIRRGLLNYIAQNGNLTNFSVNDPETHTILNHTSQTLKIAPFQYVELLGITGYYVRVTDKVEKTNGKKEALLKSDAAKNHKSILDKHIKKHGSLENFYSNRKGCNTLRMFAERHDMSIHAWVAMLGYEYEEPKVVKEEFFKKLGNMQKKGGWPGELELDGKTARELRYLAFWDNLPEYDYLLENSNFFISKTQVKLYDYISTTIEQLEDIFGEEKDEDGFKPDIAGVYKHKKLYERIRTIRRYTYPTEPIELTIMSELGFKYSNGADTKLGVKFSEEELACLIKKKYIDKKPLDAYQSKRLNSLVFAKGTLLQISCRKVYELYGIKDAKGTSKEPNRMIMIHETITYEQHQKNMKLRDEKRAKKKAVQSLANTVKRIAEKRELE